MRSSPPLPLAPAGRPVSVRFARISPDAGRVLFVRERCAIERVSFGTGCCSPSVRQRHNIATRVRIVGEVRGWTGDFVLHASRRDPPRNGRALAAGGRAIGARSFVGNLWSGLVRIDRASWRNLKLLPVTPCSQDIKREARKSMAAVKLSVAYYNCDFREIIPARNNSVPLFIVSFLAFRLSYFYDGSRAVKRPSSAARAARRGPSFHRRPLRSAYPRSRRNRLVLSSFLRSRKNKAASIRSDTNRERLRGSTE